MGEVYQNKGSHLDRSRGIPNAYTVHDSLDCSNLFGRGQDGTYLGLGLGYRLIQCDPSFIVIIDHELVNAPKNVSVICRNNA